MTDEELGEIEHDICNCDAWDQRCRCAEVEDLVTYVRLLRSENSKLTKDLEVMWENHQCCDPRR
jgi:hypothetical protein